MSKTVRLSFRSYYRLLDNVFDIGGFGSFDGIDFEFGLVQVIRTKQKKLVTTRKGCFERIELIVVNDDRINTIRACAIGLLRRKVCGPKMKGCQFQLVNNFTSDGSTCSGYANHL